MKLSSVHKTLQVIEALEKHPKSLSVSELSRLINLPKSTTHHILRALLPYNYIYQNPDDKKYTLGFRFLEIGRKMLRNLDVRQIAKEYLDRLCEESKETVHLSILRGGLVVYLERVSPPEGFSLPINIDITAEPHTCAAGKIFLSGMSQQEMSSMYSGGPLKKITNRTITSQRRLFKEIETVRNQGYALDDEEFYEGLRCVAAPIRVGDKIVAGLSISGPVFSMTMEKINRALIGMVVKTAKEISSKIDV
jgi:IclR family KDG regulon transcriptional repressor